MMPNREKTTLISKSVIFSGDGDGNGICTETHEAENEISWIAYLVGWV